jgi:hypothetical protein
MSNRFLLTFLPATIAGAVAFSFVCATPGGPSAYAAEPSIPDRTVKLPGDDRHRLWISGEYQLHENQVDLLVDFHGSPQLVRESVRVAGLNCVVLSVNYAGLSSVYRKPFSHDRQLFATILDEALSVLRADDRFTDDTAWRAVAVSSFSAGFGAVRELLKSPEYFNQIDAIYLVDSLYCGYVGDGTGDVQEGVVHPGLMKDFLRFAEESAAGSKVMIVTHCDGPTPGYASTRETADYLLEKLSLQPHLIDRVERVPASASFKTNGLRLYRQARRKGFALYGSPGGNETDHVQHLRHMACWLPRLPLAKQESATRKAREATE